MPDIRDLMPPLPATPEKILIERKLGRSMFRLGMIDAAALGIVHSRLPGHPLLEASLLVIGLGWILNSGIFAWRVAEAKKAMIAPPEDPPEPDIEKLERKQRWVTPEEDAIKENEKRKRRS